MKASEALKIQREATSGAKIEATLVDVFAKIKNAAERGKLEVHCVALDEHQLKHLRELGYTAKTEHSQIGDHKRWSVVNWKPEVTSPIERY